MQDIPTMWRIELAHPVAVHFPIALLIFGTVAWIVGRFARGDGKLAYLVPAGRTALIVGAVFAWIAIYTGVLANREVARTLCDPRVKHAHEDYAYIVSYLFSGALAVELATVFFHFKKLLKNTLLVLVGIALIAGCGLLGYTAHKGGQLVYQQAAAVHQPSERCVEFE
jgi:uncharacterized membrane protein